MTPPRNGTVTATCGACEAPLATTGRARLWCSDACRQAAWRRRHAPPSPQPALPPTRPARHTTIYQCPVCDIRQVGVQQCEECATFMHRLGPGGLTPCYQEPLTIDELLDR